MRKLDLREIQEQLLEMLLVYRDFCGRHGLSFYLVGGTLLGAIRHQGFIPWDDDIDIGMPRPDYERMIDILVKTDSAKDELPTRYSIMCPETGLDRPCTKLFDNRTDVERITLHHNESNRRLQLDILPIDGLPNEEREVEKIYRTRNRLYRFLILREARVLQGKTALRGLAKLVLVPLARIHTAKWYIDKIETLSKRYSFEESDYVGIVGMGMYGPGERIRKDEFLKTSTVVFEGIEFVSFSCWDSYLRGIYGDYMILPPAEKQEAHFETVWLFDDNELECS